jgi:hypothetical protein
MDWAPWVALLGSLLTAISTGAAVLFRWGSQQAELRAIRAERQVDTLVPAVEKLAEAMERQGTTLKDQTALIQAAISRVQPRRGSQD